MSAAKVPKVTPAAGTLKDLDKLRDAASAEKPAESRGDQLVVEIATLECVMSTLSEWDLSGRPTNNTCRIGSAELLLRQSIEALHNIAGDINGGSEAEREHSAPIQVPIPSIKPKPGSVEDLDRLSGYTGSIQGTPLDTALDEQREALWLAQSLIDTLAPALIRVFGDDGDWQAKFPEFPRVLRESSRIIRNAADNLKSGILEDRALAIARARKMAPTGVSS